MQKSGISNIFLAVCIIITTSACNRQENSVPDSPVAVDASYTLPEVKTKKAQESVFHHEILANGVVVCSNYVDAYFNSNEIITGIRIKNGDYVKRGDTLAVLDNLQAEMEMAQARIALEQAELQLKDALIGQGFDPARREGVPSDVISLLELRSGVKSARLNLRKTERVKEHTYIIAPFNGIVANLSQIQGNKADSGTPLCRILSVGDMSVEFKVIETELALINIGDIVDVYQNSGGKMLRATVSEVNPVIGDDGQITLKAKISNPGRLIAGQHVRIAVKRDLEKAIVIPKSSVVMRDHRPVVFTYSPDSTAQWNYVDVLHENLTEYAVNGLEEGMEVIVYGNKNLSQGSPVKKVD